MENQNIDTQNIFRYETSYYVKMTFKKQTNDNG